MSVSKKLYKEKVCSRFKQKGIYKNSMQIPKIEKIVLSMCVSQAVKNPKILKSVQEDLSLIAGQRAVITKAKKAISNFKLREGMPLGVRVTLRRELMWSFLDRLIHFALPKVRDFKGLSPKAFDGKGNYNMGLKEHIVFSEINYDKVESIRGMNITIKTSAKKDEEARDMLSAMNFPFRGLRENKKEE
ncbi:MAG: 50S ribosomal protein L5 [Bdellovibrionales bacterium]|nr:50S ribosomal protein L5 [Bdellovibrionales bacterium]